MPLLCKYKECGVSVAIWELCETSEELSAMLGNEFLYTYAQEHFSSESRRREWLAIRLLLSQTLGSSVAVEYTSSGRPFIAGGPEISISHTKKYAVLAISDTTPVGVDVEMRGRSTQKTRSRFMSDRELNAIGDADAELVSLIHWSVKEALFKITGDLGGNFRDNIFVESFIPAESGRLSLSILGLGMHDARYYATYHVKDDYVLTLCMNC